MARLGQFRRDTYENWMAENPILADGEFFLVAMDSSKPREYTKYGCGDGTSTFSELKTYLFEGGGGSGTTNYKDLENKPSINGIVLDGNKTSEDLDLTVSIPQATETVLGGIKAASKTSNETVEVKIGNDGKLYVPPSDEGGGTTNYDDLSNKPSINNISLNGNKTAEDLGLVASETGKELSSNDYTNAEKTKLAGIEEGANKTVVEQSVTNSTTNVPSSNAVKLETNVLQNSITNLQTKVSALSGVNTMFVGYFDAANKLPSQTSPAWALVGDLGTAKPYAYYVTGNVPTGYSAGWNDLSSVLGTYDFTDLSEYAKAGYELLGMIKQIQNQFINTEGAVSSLETFCIEVYSVIPGQTIRISTNSVNTNITPYAFYSNEDLTGRISKGAPSAPFDKVVTVPTGANYLAVSHNYNTPTKVMNVYKPAADNNLADVSSLLEWELYKQVLVPDGERKGVILDYYTSGFRGTGEYTGYVLDIYNVTPGDTLRIEGTFVNTTAFNFYSDANYSNVVLWGSHNSDAAVNTFSIDKEIIVPENANYLIVCRSLSKSAKVSKISTKSRIDSLEEAIGGGGGGTDKKNSNDTRFNYNKWYNLLNDTRPKADYTKTQSFGTITVAEDFALYNASRFLLLEAKPLSSNIAIFTLNKSDFRQELMNNRTVHVKFLLKSSVSASLSLHWYIYQKNGNFGSHRNVNIAVTANAISEVSDTFTIPSSINIDNIGYIELFFIGVPVGTYKLANIKLFDSVKSKTYENQISKEDLGINIIEKKYYNKNCIYIGDSISTANNYHWKGYLEDNYKLNYVRDKTELPPANGGRSVIPPVTEGSTAESKSIWYRCAANRMAIYNFDVISLNGGTNDMNTNSLLVGTINDTPYVDTLDGFSDDKKSKLTATRPSNLSFAASLMGCIEMLQRDFPNKEIILSTVMYCGLTYGTVIDLVSEKPLSEAVAFIQMKIAEKYGLKCVPLYWDMRNKDTLDLFSADKVHPNKAQAIRMMSLFAQTMVL